MKSVLQSMLWGGAAVCVQMSLCASARATIVVRAGYDLFTTQAGTTFNGVPLHGVPLGTFNFGPPIGTQNVTSTDTIVQRLANVTVAAAGQTGNTGLVMPALQLETTIPVDFGLGLDFYFVTLQSARGGPASTGTMAITFATAGGGTFSSSLDVFFDIRKGSLNGPVAQSSDLVLSSTAAVWGRTPQPGALQINGANAFLNGTDHSEDFFLLAPLTETHPSGATHVVNDTGVPAPGTGAVVGLGALVAARRRNGHRA